MMIMATLMMIYRRKAIGVNEDDRDYINDSNYIIGGCLATYNYDYIST